MSRRGRILVVIIFIVAAIGFLDAAYLTGNALRGIIPPCTIDGCETVLTSQYAKFFGIPVSLFGALFYLAVLFTAYTFLTAGDTKALRALRILTTIIFLASLGFVYLQLFVIHAICIYCMISVGSSTALFVLSWFLPRKGIDPSLRSG